jgi:hypothetical protein
MSRIAAALFVFAGSWAAGTMVGQGRWDDAATFAAMTYAYIWERRAWQKATGRAEAAFVEGSDEG